MSSEWLAIGAETDPLTRARVLQNEQAALRRVATLVAHGAPPYDVFGAAAEEIARVFSLNELRRAFVFSICRSGSVAIGSVTTT
jgi:hypothetical protein